MPELGPYGSVRGALSNERPYRDLRNVAANYPFERSHRFAGIQPTSGHGDHSRLSCRAGDTQLGAGFCRDLQQASLAWTILDARGRSPNVRSSSQLTVRPRSRGSLPRLPYAASVGGSGVNARPGASGPIGDSPAPPILGSGQAHSVTRRCLGHRRREGLMATKQRAGRAGRSARNLWHAP